MASPPRTTSANQPEPSPYIYVSGISTPRPLSELKHWHSRGHYIYDKLRCPVLPASVAGHGPDRLATATSAHPIWSDTLDQVDISNSEQMLMKQIGEIEDAEKKLELDAEEKKLAAEEEERLEAKEQRKKEIRAKTWTGSRGKYGNEAGARPHAFHGRAGGANLKLVSLDMQIPAQPSTGHDQLFPHTYHHQLGHPSMHPHDLQYQYQPPSMNPDPYPMQSMIPAPTAFMLDDMVTPAPGFVQPAVYTSTYGHTTFDDVVRGMERQVLGDMDTPRPVPAQPQQSNGSGVPAWSTAQHAAAASTPTMSILSPRVAAFVPDGIFSPAVDSVMPVEGAIGARPSPCPKEQQQQPTAKGYHSRKESDLNPMAGAFRPRAMLPMGLSMEVGEVFYSK